MGDCGCKQQNAESLFMQPVIRCCYRQASVHAIPCDEVGRGNKNLAVHGTQPDPAAFSFGFRYSKQ